MSVTVPGALAGWDMLVRTHGRRTLAQALQPAIAYARDGFPVSPIIAAQWANETAFLQRDSAAAATYLPRRARAEGRGVVPQSRLRAHAAGRSPTSGIGTFYGGALGQRIVARLAALNGFVTLDDLRKNAPNWVTPISVPFRGYRVWELPPNNQGIAALEMLRILEPYDLKAMGHNSPAYLHHLIEAKKLAYADLDRFVGDADHLDMPAEADAHRRVHRRAAQSHRTRPGAGTRRPGTAADEERDDLPHRRRRRGQHGVVHQLDLRLLRIGDRGAGHRLRAAQPRRGVHADARACRTPSRRASVRSTR